MIMVSAYGMTEHSYNNYVTKASLDNHTILCIKKHKGWWQGLMTGRSLGILFCLKSILLVKFT